MYPPNMASYRGAGEGYRMLDKVALTADQEAAVIPSNQLSHSLPAAARESLKRNLDLSSQAPLQYQRRRVIDQPSFSPFLLQKALDETSGSQLTPAFFASANTTLDTVSAFTDYSAYGSTMSQTELPTAASVGAPTMTRMLEHPSAPPAAFKSPTYVSDLTSASLSPTMTPATFLDTPNISMVPHEGHIPASMTYDGYPTFIPPSISTVASDPGRTNARRASAARNLIPAHNSMVPPERPIYRSLPNFGPTTLMPPPISTVPTTSTTTRRVTRHSGVVRNLVPASSISTVGPEGPRLSSLPRSGPQTLISPPISTVSTAPRKRARHHVWVARDPFPASSVTMIGPEGPVITSLPHSGPSAFLRPPIPALAPALGRTGTTGNDVARNLVPATAMVRPEGPVRTSLSNSGHRILLHPPTSTVASRRTVTRHTDAARNPVLPSRRVVPGAFSLPTNSPVPASAPQNFPLGHVGTTPMTPAEAAMRNSLPFLASAAKASPPYPAIQAPTMPHIKWKGFTTSCTLGFQCMLCKRDLASTPEAEGRYSIPEMSPPVAVLPCGHTFHDRCLQIMTTDDQSNDPSCIPCAIGDN